MYVRTPLLQVDGIAQKQTEPTVGLSKTLRIVKILKQTFKKNTLKEAIGRGFLHHIVVPL